MTQTWNRTLPSVVVVTLLDARPKSTRLPLGMQQHEVPWSGRFALRSSSRFKRRILRVGYELGLSSSDLCQVHTSCGVKSGVK